jgi:hypothetical protein
VTQVANVADTSSFVSALESARSGMQHGLRGLASDAQAVAHANVDKDGQVPDLANSLVNSLQDRLLVQLSARVMRAVGETLGTIIDVQA